MNLHTLANLFCTFIFLNSFANGEKILENSDKKEIVDSGQTIPFVYKKYIPHNGYGYKVSTSDKYLSKKGSRKPRDLLTVNPSSVDRANEDNETHQKDEVWGLSVEEIPVKALKALITLFKNDVCEVNPRGDFSFNFGIKGGLLGILEADGGLKITIKCENPYPSDTARP